MRDDSGWTEAEAARHLGVSSGALRVWRLKGRGPRFCRFGRCVRYMRSDVEAYVEAQTVRPGATAEKPREIGRR